MSKILFMDIVLEIIAIIATAVLVILEKFGHSVPLEAILLILLILLGISIQRKINSFRANARKNKKAEKMEKDVEESNRILKQITENKEKRIKDYEEQNRLISKLIDEGLIDEDVVYSKIKRNDFFSLFCYQKVPDDDEIRKNVLPEFRNPVLEAAEEIGFIRLGRRHNFYILPAEYLNKKHRNVKSLEILFKKTIRRKWKESMKKIQELDESFYKNYKKKNPEAMNCSYFLSHSNFHEVIIDYFGYNCFDPRFTELMESYVDLKKLKKDIQEKKHEIKRFVFSISNELLLENIPEEDRKIIIQNENKIRKEMNIVHFTDYRKVEKNLIETLEKHISDDKKVREYSEEIVRKSQKYYELFSKLGIDVDKA